MAASGGSARHPIGLRVRRLLPGLALALALSGCDTPEEREARHLERGLELVAGGEDARALVEFKNVLELNPKNTRAIFEVGRIHERADRPYDAFAAFWKTALEAPEFLPAQLKVGELSLVFQQLERARAAADTIAELAPDQPDGLALRGAIALREDDLDEAERLARAALERAPQHGRAAAVLVGVLHRRGQDQQALRRLEEALHADPDDLELRTLEIALLAEAGDVAGVRKAYEVIFELSPRSVARRLEAAELLLRHGWHDQVEEVLEDAIGDGLLDPDIAIALVDLIAQRRGPAEAETELLTLIDLMPDAPELRFKLVDGYLARGRRAEAERVLDGLIAGGEHVDVVSDARVRLARIRFEDGERDGALQLIDQVLGEVDDHPLAHLQRAIILRHEGDLSGAVLSARASLQRDHGWLPGLRLLAALHLERGETADALTAYANLARQAPDDQAVLERLASLLMQEGEDQAALKLWDRVLELDPGSVPALRARTLIAIARQTWSEAAASIARLEKLEDQAPLAATLTGWLHLARGDFAAGREAFRTALAGGVDAHEVNAAIVRSYLAEGDEDEAIDFLEQQAAERPEDASALALLGRLLARQGQLERARQSFEQAIRIAPERIPLYTTFSDILYQGGDLSGSIEAVQAALAQRPDDPGLLDRLAQMQLRAGAPERAISTYERLLETGEPSDQAINNYAALIADFRFDDPEALREALALTKPFEVSDDPELLDTRAWLHYRQGDLAAAEAYLARAAASAAASAQIHYHLGMVLLEQGREQEAIVALERAVQGEAGYVGRDEARAALARLRREVAGEEAAES